MRIASVAILLALTTPASADPTCNVRVVRAPDDVRAAIEARIGIESSCTTLDVRVVPTREGYYVIATPPHGDVFEGSVRDPGLVGELVTGWARLPAAAPIERAGVVAEQPPSATPIADVIERQPTRRHGRTRELALGPLVTPSSYGLRAELDLFAASGFSLGIAAGIASAHWTYGDARAEGADLEFRDIRGLLVVAKTFGSGPWRVRLQGGIGVLHTEYAGTMRSMFDAGTSGEGFTRMAEAALTVSRDVAASWALSIGPMLTYYAQRYDLDDTIESFEASREYDVGAFAAIRRRL